MNKITLTYKILKFIFFEEYLISSSEKKSDVFSNLTLSNLLVKLIKASSPFSLTLLFLRFIGMNIGWGMQFQQPIFLIILAMILFLFSINLFGFFEFKVPNIINSMISFNTNSSKYFRDF